MVTGLVTITHQVPVEMVAPLFGEHLRLIAVVALIQMEISGLMQMLIGQFVSSMVDMAMLGLMIPISGVILMVMDLEMNITSKRIQQLV